MNVLYLGRYEFPINFLRRDLWRTSTIELSCVLMLRPISPELAMFPDIPRYFCFPSYENICSQIGWNRPLATHRDLRLSAGHLGRSNSFYLCRCLDGHVQQDYKTSMVLGTNRHSLWRHMTEIVDHYIKQQPHSNKRSLHYKKFFIKAKLLQFACSSIRNVTRNYMANRKTLKPPKVHCRLVGWLRFNATYSNISAIKWRISNSCPISKLKIEVPRNVRNSKIRKQDKLRRDW